MGEGGEDSGGRYLQIIRTENIVKLIHSFVVRCDPGTMGHL